MTAFIVGSLKMFCLKTILPVYLQNEKRSVILVVERKKSTMNLREFNFNTLPYLKHEQLPVGRICDDRLFDVFSASECFRFKV